MLVLNFFWINKKNFFWKNLHFGFFSIFLTTIQLVAYSHKKWFFTVFMQILKYFINRQNFIYAIICPTLKKFPHCCCCAIFSRLRNNKNIQSTSINKVDDDLMR